jgi:regulator of replication initiation timing
LKSQAISQDIETLQQEVSDLHAQAEADSAAFAALEAQLSELKERLSSTQGNLAGYEARLAEKQTELAQAKRDEAAKVYEETVRAREEAAARVAQAANNVLSELDAYEQATRTFQELIDDMRGAGAPGNGFVAPDLSEAPEVFGEPWESLVAAVKLRINEQFENELVEAAASSLMGKAIDELPEHLQELARTRRRERIKGKLARR